MESDIREASPSILFSELDRRAFRISELERQNKDLRAQLADTLEETRHGVDSTTSREKAHNGRGSSPADFAALNQRYHDLQQRHAKLEETHKGCDEAVQRALRKYDAAKKVIKQWKEYIEKQRTLPIIASPKADETLAGRDQDTTPRPTAHVSRPPLLLDVDSKDEQQLEDGLPSRPSSRTSKTQNRSSSPSKASSQAKRVTSSQTTDDASSPTNGKSRDDDNDDEIEVVREVNLKRKRSNSGAVMPPPRRIKQEPISQERPGSAQRPLELNSEDFSSPIARRYMAVRTETSDLDALIAGQALQVPVLARGVQSRARSEEVGGSGSLLVPRVTRQDSSLSDSDILELEKPSKNQLDVPEESTVLGEPMKRGRPGTKRRSNARNMNALRQISPNLRSSPGKQRQHDREAQDDADKVAFVSEDGDGSAGQVAAKSKQAPGQVTKSAAALRLDALLEKPTPAKTSLQKWESPAVKESVRPRHAAKEHNNHVKVVTPTTRRDIHHGKPGRPKGVHGSPPPARPDDEPLRSKPWTALRLEDFRPNPKYLNSDFAFADSIRGRDARRCLPGCTKPECCGQFLDAARRRLLPPTNKSDRAVLQDYLGPTFEAVLATYSAAKREEMLFEARAFEAANISGKHKQAFERAKSPPGFWRTDMPSTQEEEEYRRKALEMEREKVEQRWHEALRGNGRWLFRDE